MKFYITTIFVINVLCFSAYSFLGVFEKKQKPVVEEKLSEDDKIGYVDRSDKDLSTLKSINVFVSDSLDVNSVFKIKSILQDNEKIYKVNHTDNKNFVVFFNGPVDPSLVLDLIEAAGFQGQVK